MEEKTLKNARICLKGDTEANWNRAIGFVPKDKEIIIYKADTAHPIARLKVGDGKTTVQELPFSGADMVAIEQLIDDKGELLVEYIDNAVTTIIQVLDNKLDKTGGMVDGDLSVQGNLNVTGTIITRDAETLTVKDMLIAVNGQNTPLALNDKTGLLTIIGKKQYTLPNRMYFLDKAKFKMASNEVIDRFNNLQLHAELYKGSTLLKGFLTARSEGSSLNFYIDSTQVLKDSYSLFSTVNQEVKEEDRDFVNSFLQYWKNGAESAYITNDDYILEPQAYASPIYNVYEDTLQIGLGTYTKNDENNVIAFTFNGGQGQCLATRDDSITDGNLVRWDDKAKKLVDAGEACVEPIEYSKDITISTISDNGVYGRAYIRDKDNTDNSIVLDSYASKYTIPVRNNNANFYVRTPQYSYECTNKEYVDNNFIKKLTSLNNDIGAYVQKPDGTILFNELAGTNRNFKWYISRLMPAGSTTTQPSGVNVTATPQGDWDCVPKKYADSLLDTAKKYTDNEITTIEKKIAAATKDAILGIF